MVFSTKDLECILAIVRSHDLVAMPRQSALCDAADSRLVLDQEYRSASPQLVLLGLSGAA